MVSIYQLNNGIRVALEEIPYVRSISIGIWVGNGSRNETKETNGISHFLEHMFFKGTSHRSARDIAEEMDAIGGQINAYTTKEYTCYYTRVLDKHFSSALDILSDMYLHSVFREEDIEKERNVILEEILMYDDSPEDLVHDSLQEAIWRTSTLGMPILGTANSLSGFTRKTFLEYYGSNYHPQNTVISIAGNFHEKEVLAQLENTFGKWQVAYPYERKQEKTVYTPSFVKIEKDIEQVHQVFTFPSFPRDSQYKYALSVFNTVFGGGMSSRLFQRIREERGLTYSIYSYISSFSDAGIFGIYASMHPNQVKTVSELIVEEIEAGKEWELSEDLLRKTKEQIISNFILGTESTSNRMTSSGSSLLIRNKIQSQEEIIENIDKITKEDILDVTHKIFDFTKLSVSLVGNVRNLDTQALFAPYSTNWK